jgi:hypothetical protein
LAQLEAVWLELLAAVADRGVAVVAGATGTAPFLRSTLRTRHLLNAIDPDVPQPGDPEFNPHPWRQAEHGRA